ncbi:MAG: hypothetical protein RIA64_01325 [Rhodospirillales bacterium]
MSISLTEQQHRLLTFIKGYLSDHGGRGPSFEDMKAAMGLRSKAGVHRLLTGLETRGYIRRHHGLARAIEVIDPNDQHPAARETNVDTEALAMALVAAARAKRTPDEAPDKVRRIWAQTPKSVRRLWRAQAEFVLARYADFSQKPGQAGDIAA